MKCDFCDCELELIEGIWGWMYRCHTATCPTRYMEASE